MKTRLITDDIDSASELIKKGELVAVPTETVYGLAGNGLSAEAVEKIYEVKGRPAVKPLALMVPDGAAMDEYCTEVPAQAKLLAEKFWPGPLSIVLKSKDIVPEIVRAGGETVSLRCPDHPLTLELLGKTGLPLAAPSANPSSEPSPKTAAKVMEYFDGAISAVIDGGECGLGRESTIIDVSRTPYRILRQGALPESEIVNALVGGLTVIGITGGSGCGKTTALKELAAMGALAIDCDEVYHELLETDAELLSELKTEFPEAFTDGVLDRKLLAGTVFADKGKLLQLNKITHCHVTAEIGRRISDFAMCGGRLCAIDAVALIESGQAERCDIVIGVVADREKRIGRIMRRDKISREYAEKRIDAQKNDEFYYKNCNYVLEANTDSQALRAKVRNLLIKEELI